MTNKVNIRFSNWISGQVLIMSRLSSLRFTSDEQDLASCGLTSPTVLQLQRHDVTLAASMCPLTKGVVGRQAAPSPIVNVSGSHSHTLTSVCPSPVVSVTDCHCVCVSVCGADRTEILVTDSQPSRKEATTLVCRRTGGTSLCVCVSVGERVCVCGREGDADAR